MTKLSFIVPVYNVAPYLRKCVDSLLAQDYDDYEIILVDDGSTDDSWQIIQEYVSRFRGLEDERIRGIHQENGGLSAARNAGIKAAQGEYICFVDSDDYWEENVLGGLMEQVEREELDVLRFDYQNVRIVKSEEGIVNSKYEVFNPYKRDHRLDNDYSEIPTDGVSFLNSRMNTQCYAVMFIVKRSLLINGLVISDERLGKECLFKEGIYFEDTDWTPRMLVRAKRVASTSTVVYNYLMREGSITKTIDRTKQKKVLDDKMRLVEEMQKQSKELQEHGKDNRWFKKMIADTVISIMGILSAQFYDERKQYLAQLREQDIYPVQSQNAKARLINVSPRLAVMLLHLKNA